MKRMYTLKRVWTLELSEEESEELYHLLQFANTHANQLNADKEIMASLHWLESLDKTISAGEVQVS